MDYKFVHTCPHCGTTLSVKPTGEARVLTLCPSCHGYILLLNFGETIKAPHVYKCHKCNEHLIYENVPPFVHCDKCDSLYIPSNNGDCIIDAGLLAKGDKGELPFKKKQDHIVALKNKWRFLPNKIKGGIYAGIAATICLLIGLFIYSLPARIETTKAYAAMDSLWTDFRNKNPYNIQIEGIKQFDDNSYVAIISEPSQYVSEEDLENFFDKYNCAFKTFKKKIGYDGWLRDAVVAFNNLDKEDIPNFSKKLSKLLYGTDYKASLLNLENIPKHTAFSSFDLNNSVSEEELRKWFIEDKEPLIAYKDSTYETNMEDRLTVSTYEYSTELYMSKRPGFVVWVLDKGECDTIVFREMARKFALDTDLILGAITSERRVAIIGRERCVPIYELPPMRVETLCLLASTENGQLAQSYERTSLFAGKLPGGKDWAPIYLSDELWHTEYGSILNVTDQMLKSWSENGMIDYVDFNCPKPVNWTFNKGVMQDLKVNQLTYNWNTEGAGYIVEDSTYSIFALNRTGSLPVSYIPGESKGISAADPVYQAEQEAYDFFSNLSSPELVKVVQYTAMYQIFHNLGVSISLSQDDDTIYRCENSDSMINRATKTMQTLSSFGIKEISIISKTYGVDIVNKGKQHWNVKDFKRIYDIWGYYVSREILSHVITNDGVLINNKYALRKNISSPKDSDNIWKCVELIADMDSLHKEISTIDNSKEFQKFFACMLTDRNNVLAKDANNHIIKFGLITNITFIEEANKLQEKYGSAIQNYNTIIGGKSVTFYRNQYLQYNKDKYRTWIKCPTIVESWSLTDSATVTGGHNLDAKITNFKVSKELKPGETKTIEINGKKTVLISESDRRLYVGDPSYLRQVGRLGKIKLSDTKTVTRSRDAVIGITKKRTSRGFNTNDHNTVITTVNDGFVYRGKKYTDFTLLLEAVSKEMPQGDVFSFEIQGFKKAGVDIDLIMGNVRYSIHKGNNSAIPLSKYDFNHHTTSISGDKAFVQIPIKAGTMQFGSTSNVLQAGMGGSSNVSPRINVLKGNVVFEVPKVKLQAFLNVLKRFSQTQIGYMNELKLKMEMKRNGINPTDCDERIKMDVEKEMKHLKIAKIKDLKNPYYVRAISKEEVA